MLGSNLVVESLLRIRGSSSNLSGLNVTKVLIGAYM